MHGVLLGVAALSCPVGMGLMMWFMGKGMRGQPKVDATPERSTVEQLRAEHQRLGAELERLDEQDQASSRAQRIGV